MDISAELLIDINCDSCRDGYRSMTYLNIEAGKIGCPSCKKPLDGTLFFKICIE